MCTVEAYATIQRDVQGEFFFFSGGIFIYVENIDSRMRRGKYSLKNYTPSEISEGANALQKD